jgi:hypothetical protein
MCFGGKPNIPPPPPLPVPPPPPAPTAMMVQKAPTDSMESYKSRMSAAARTGKSSLVIPLAGGMSGGTGIGTTP